MLKVTVHNAVSVPNLERFTNVDPLVALIFQGVTKQTNWQRSTCDPKWEETLDFSLNHSPLNKNDVLNIHLKDHETLGTNKLIGQAVVPLLDVLRFGTIKNRAIQLTNPQGILLEGTKLYLTLNYTPPTNNVNDDVNGKKIDSYYSNKDSNELSNSPENIGDYLFKQQNSFRSMKCQDFQIRIKIFEARQLDGINIDPVCRVRLFGIVKQTKIQKGTNHPYFNEVFFFNLNKSQVELCDQSIEFDVFNSRTFRSDMKIGQYKLDISHVYAQTKHSINRKWLLLSTEDDQMTSGKGYLKVSVNILGPGDEPPTHDNRSDNDDDDVETNLLKPVGIMLRPATFILKLYKAEDLPRMDSAFLHGVKKLFHSSEDIKDLIDPYVIFSFAGQQVQSKVIYTCSHPEFNQELRLPIKFPSMCDKIKITMMDWDRLQFDDITGTTVIDIRFICDDRENGFLPTFGPCWINLYGAPREYSELKSPLDDLNTGKGEGVAYRGRIFVELQTILGEFPKEPISDISNFDIIRTLPYQSRKKYKLHTAFLDASMLFEHESTIEFEISIGNYGNKSDDLVGNANCSTTSPTNPVFDGSSYYFLPWGHTKPCVQVSSEWEDIGFRLETINQIEKIKLFIIGVLSTFDIVRTKKLSEEIITRHCKQTLDRLISHLRKPLPDQEIARQNINELDRFRRQMREKDLNMMILTLEKLKTSAKTSQEIFLALENIRDQLDQLKSEPQNSIPDVIIWLLANGKRYAYHRLPAHEVFYSVDPDRRGHLCGRVQTITLKWPGELIDIPKERRFFIPAQIRLKIWFGLSIHEQDWFSQQKGADLAIYAETYENQTNVLGQWTTSGPLMTRPPWSDVTGQMSLPKTNFRIPVGWRWDGDWYISPEISARLTDDTGHRTYTEELFEHQYRLIAGAQWQRKSIEWTNMAGDKVPGKDERINAPMGWQWEDDWTIDTNRAVDEQGFEYCVNQTLSNWCPVEKIFHLNRRRRWHRTRLLADDPRVQERKKKEIENDLRTGGWEYAPMFNMRFHADERSMDMTRRRRWHRKMVPNRISTSSNTALPSNEMVLINTDVVFRMQSSVSNSKVEPQSMDNSTESSKDIKIELNAPRMFLSFKKPYYYELRAYIFQARNLLSMDDDGFSDPYAQIGFINQSQRTEVIHKSLCPTWDQTLIFSNVELYGEPDDIYHDPPNILIELFDKDNYGSPDFLGRVQCFPIIRLVLEENKPTVKLNWFQIKRGKDEAGELLAAFELFLLPENESETKLPPYPPKENMLFRVPDSIRPELVRTGVEILCWGVRNMKSFLLSDVDSPQVVFEVGGRRIESTIIKCAKKSPNFDKPFLFLDVMLPKDDIYTPPMNIKVKDYRSFGRKPVVGFHIIKSLESFRCDPTLPSLTFIESEKSIESIEFNDDHQNYFPMNQKKKRKLRKMKLFDQKSEEELKLSNTSAESANLGETMVDKKTMRKRVKQFFKKLKSPSQNREKSETKFMQIQKSILKNQLNYQSLTNLEESSINNDIDWWSKYYASKGQLNKCGNYLTKENEILKIYTHPLEFDSVYQGFNDFCQTFPLYRGKTKFEEENQVVGEFKGLFKVYPLSDDKNAEFPHRIMEHFPWNCLEECLIRIYIIRGIDLQPQDSNGKSDPYIEIELGKICLDNRDEKISNTTNPIFGKMFEMKTIIPIAKDLIIRVKDWDLLTADDLIGQTTIDLENRFLSKFRPTCGLPVQYNISGPNQWRDSITPRRILYDICKRNNLPIPQLLDDGGIQIGDLVFRNENFVQEKNLTNHVGEPEERLALYILHKLHLCPEHVETRPLYNTLQPFVEQGRLELFIDIFPLSQGPPGPALDIKPRKPKPYVFRCIIWNTSNVILQETSITGEKMSDIYVKGWMTGMEDDLQKTDVHYRSMDGEGNFNWRFIYNFDYFPTEQSISVRKKEHFWSLDATELLLPPVLNLQIWDNDKFTPDDFLGALTLDLNHLCKPAKDSDRCDLEILNEKSTKSVSLFQMKRLKGWWPCIDLENGKTILTGKIELELEILNEFESIERPAGRGREKPNENPTLEIPKRPATSFLWFTSPILTFKNIIWKKSKWYIIGLLIFLCFLLFVLLFLWSLPNVILSHFIHLSN